MSLVQYHLLFWHQRR